MSWGVNPYALHLFYFSTKRSKWLLGYFLPFLIYYFSWISSRTVFLFAAAKIILNVFLNFIYFCNILFQISDFLCFIFPLFDYFRMFVILPVFLFTCVGLPITMTNVAISGKYSKWLINIRFMLSLIFILENWHFIQEIVSPLELKPSEKFKTKTNGICAI